MLWENLLAPSDMGRPDRCVTDARGCEVEFADGTRAICLSSGLWNVNFGYGNETVAAEIAHVLGAGHYASLFRYTHPRAHQVASELLDRVGWPGGALVFSTSGSALNDTIVKLARHWAHLQGRGPARTVLTAQGSYHGMTLNSMQLSGDELNQALYGARSNQHVHLPADDPDAWEQFFALRGPTVSLVLLEPILGTGAHHVAPEVLDVIFRARQEHGFLLAADEVATGFYRVGALAASSRWAQPPDILGFSKGLTNGTAASAALVMSPRVADPFRSQDSMFVHGETQAGSPVASAAILGVLKFIDSIDIHHTYTSLARRVGEDLDALAGAHGWTRRGEGLFQFLGWPADGRFEGFTGMPAVDHFRTHGVMVHPSVDGVQIVPQVTMPLDQWHEAIGRVDSAIRAWPSPQTKRAHREYSRV